MIKPRKDEKRGSLKDMEGRIATGIGINEYMIVSPNFYGVRATSETFQGQG